MSTAADLDGNENISSPTPAAGYSAVVDVSAVVDRTNPSFSTPMYAEKARRLVRRGGFLWIRG